MKYQTHTFGCKVNTYDTGLIQKNLLKGGFEHSQEDSRIHVLNTCAVTAEATKEAVKMIRKAVVQTVSEFADGIFEKASKRNDAA